MMRGCFIALLGRGRIELAKAATARPLPAHRTPPALPLIWLWRSPIQHTPDELTLRGEQPTGPPLHAPDRDRTPTRPATAAARTDGRCEAGGSPVT
jgi:hypothetical protein